MRYIITEEVHSVSHVHWEVDQPDSAPSVENAISLVKAGGGRSARLFENETISERRRIVRVTHEEVRIVEDFKAQDA